MTETAHHRPTLVLGGTGKTGRRVVERLTRRHLPVRIGSRRGGVPFDWDDPSTWAPALDGVGAVYVSYFPDAAAPAVLTEDGHVGEVYELTGPRLLTFADATGIIAEAAGRPVTYTEIPAE